MFQTLSRTLWQHIELEAGSGPLLREQIFRGGAQSRIPVLVCHEVISSLPVDPCASCPHISRWQQLPRAGGGALAGRAVLELEFSLPLPCLPFRPASCHTPDCRWQQEERFSYFFVTSALGSTFLLLALGFWVSSEPWLDLGHFEGFDEWIERIFCACSCFQQSAWETPAVSMGM